jgi:hypothetical protein
LQVREVRRIHIPREMIFSGAQVVLKVMPGTIDKVTDESGPVEWIVPMGAQACHNENFSLDVRNQKRFRLYGKKKSTPTRNLFDVGDSDKGHVANRRYLRT